MPCNGSAHQKTQCANRLPPVNVLHVQEPGSGYGCPGEPGQQNNPCAKARTPYRVLDRWSVFHLGKLQAGSDALDSKLSGQPFEYQRAVGAAKAKIVLDGNVDLHIAGRIGAVIQVTFRVLVEDVDGRRALLMMQGKYRKY
jgi:hypothetical protein